MIRLWKHLNPQEDAIPLSECEEQEKGLIKHAGTSPEVTDFLIVRVFDTVVNKG